MQELHKYIRHSFCRKKSPPSCRVATIIYTLLYSLQLQLSLHTATASAARRINEFTQRCAKFPSNRFPVQCLAVCVRVCIICVCVCVYIPGLHNSNNNNSNNYDNDNGDDPCLKNSLPSLPLPLTLSPTHTPLSLCLVSPSVTINRFVAAIVVDLSQLS